MKVVSSFLLLFIVWVLESSAQNITSKVKGLHQNLKKFPHSSDDLRIQDSNKIIILCQISYEYRFTTPDSSLYYAQLAIDQSNKIGWEKGMAFGYGHLATAYNAIENYAKSIQSNFKAIEIWKRLARPPRQVTEYESLIQQARNYGNLSIGYLAIDSFEKGVKYLFDALAIDEKLNNKPGMANRYLNLGALYAEDKVKRYDLAILYSKKADSITKLFPNTNREIVIYGNLGNAYFQIKNFDSSAYYLNKGIVLCRTIGDNYNLSHQLLVCGEVMVEQGKLDTAFSVIREAIRLGKTFNDSDLVYKLYHNLGGNFNQLGQFDSAIHCFNLSNDWIGARKENDWRAKNYEKLSEAYAAIGNFETSMRYYKNFHRLSDSTEELRKRLKYLTEIAAEYKYKKEQLAREYEFKLKEAKSETEKKYIIAEAEKKHRAVELEKQLKVSQLNNAYLLKVKETENIETKIIIQELRNKKAISVLENENLRNQNLAEKEKNNKNLFMFFSAIAFLTVMLSFFYYKSRRDRDIKKREWIAQQQKIETALCISELEMSTLLSQMNPHFIFNALNSIRYYSMKSSNEKYGEYLIKFSKLIRSILENSQKRYIRIEVELEMLRNYMDLERLRLPFPFVSQIEVDHRLNIQEDMIPPMFIQPFVENSIEHGFKSMLAPGELRITFELEDNMVKIVIVDNGVGRAKNAQIQTNNPDGENHYGIPVAEERIRILNELYKVPASILIEDHFINDKPSGTRVAIVLPLKDFRLIPDENI
jgi:tetratricopeptide (TPR) repeat protein